MIAGAQSYLFNSVRTKLKTLPRSLRGAVPDYKEAVVTGGKYIAVPVIDDTVDGPSVGRGYKITFGTGNPSIKRRRVIRGKHRARRQEKKQRYRRKIFRKP
ncbi:MAG: hypothetical protein LBK66_07140 [Spirochaetaceae bacterium]|nr:hypothetical protein [Spirochaetaceae bacterium]